MSELIIHIGSHKTGTSSIQYACAQGLQEQNGQDVVYLSDGVNAYNLIQASGKVADFRARLLADRADLLLKPEADRNIVSSEGFFWLHEPEDVGQLADIVKPRFDKITILSYLRRQDMLAVSHRGQVMNRSHAARFYGVRASPLPEYGPHLHRFFDYAAKLHDLWGGAFGIENVLVVPFEREVLIGEDVVTDFAARIGVRLDLAEPVRRNKSPVGDRLMVGLKLAELGVPKDARRKYFRHLKAEGSFLPSRAEARAFLAHFEASNERLSRLFSFDGKPFRFGTSFGMYPEETGEQWSNERVERVVGALLRAKEKQRPAKPAVVKPAVVKPTVAKPAPERE